jgi:hypothetical protein
MRTRLAILLLPPLAAAVAIGLSAAPAVAATTWTVKPGSVINATSGTTTLKDTTTGTALTCTSSAAKTTLGSGSGLPGTSIGSVTSIGFAKCTGPFGLAFTVTAGALPWHINAVSFNSASGTTTGTLTGVHAGLSGPGCTAVVDGTGATAHNGKVTITYTNSSHTLKVLTTGGNLHIYSVSGCAGAVHSGDAATQSAAYAISPAQAITFATATSWTVRPGSVINATSGTSTLKDTTTGTSLSCTSSAAKTTLHSGSGLPGTAIGSVTSIGFTKCTGPFGMAFAVTAGALPWHINAVSFNSASGTTTGTLSGVHAGLSGPGCTAVVDGTGATAHNGTVTITYTNSSHTLKVLTTGGNLHIYSVSGCAGAIHSGDAATQSAAYAVSPAQTITSP